MATEEIKPPEGGSDDGLQTGPRQKEEKEAVVQPASLQLCNLVSQGMSLAEAKKKLGVK